MNSNNQEPASNKTDEQISRKAFIKTAAVTAAGSAAAFEFLFRRGLGQGGPTEAAPAAKMLKRAIPSSGEKLSVIGLGTSDEFNDYNEASVAALSKVVSTFIEMGGQLIDTAPSYGLSEKTLGDIVERLGVRDQLFLATKVSVRGKDQLAIDQLNESHRRMKLKKLDLIEVHSLVQAPERLKTLRKWKEEGKVRYIGITHHRNGSHPEIVKLMKNEPIDFVQVNYSPTETNAAKEILPLAAEKNIAIMVNRPFMNGYVFKKTKGKALPAWAADFDCTSWAQLILKYILGHPAVTCVIPATSNPRHMADNMKAGYGRLPDEKQRRQILDFVKSL